MAKTRGFFIVLEGIDKCGKSTQAKMLAAYLKRKGIACIHTREPGGTPLAEKIRNLILKTEGFVSPRAELLLYEASRAQHIQEKVLPALKKGFWVICERFCMATSAYQGFGRGLPLPEIKKLNRFASFGLIPDATIILDIPVSVFRRRVGRRDRMEAKDDFLESVRRGYLRLGSRERAVLIDANTQPNSLHKKILDALKTYVLKDH